MRSRTKLVFQGLLVYLVEPGLEGEKSSSPKLLAIVIRLFV